MATEYISRDKFVHSIDELLLSPYASQDELFSCGAKDALKLVRDMLLNKCPDSWKIPAEDVRPVVRGKWIASEKIKGYDVCSSCLDCYIDSNWGGRRWNFCPNCGADMRGGGEDG